MFMKKNYINSSILLYYINLLGLISNLVFFYLNLTILKNDLKDFFIMPIITLIGFYVSKYLKKKLKLSKAKLYTLNFILFFNNS